MLPDDILYALHKLSKAEKVQAFQYLANALALEEEPPLQSGGQYEIWSPYDAHEAAGTLLDLLDIGDGCAPQRARAIDRHDESGHLLRRGYSVFVTNRQMPRSVSKTPWPRMATDS